MPVCKEGIWKLCVLWYGSNLSSLLLFTVTKYALLWQEVILILTFRTIYETAFYKVAIKYKGLFLFSKNN